MVLACATSSKRSNYSLENCFKQVHGALKKIIYGKNGDKTTSLQTVFTSRCLFKYYWSTQNTSITT